MALIYFYDSTELDKIQLTDGLIDTDHHWEFVDEKISNENLNPDTEVLSVFVTSSITKEIIDKLPKLRLIACRSTGYNNIDLDAAKTRDITVANVPTYGDVTVAEYAFALLLSLTRKIPQVVEAENENVKPRELNGQDLAGKTLGVIGTGHIGQRVISIANGFGMKVLAYDKFPNQNLLNEYVFEYTDLDKVLADSNIVTLHVPFFPDSNHLISEKELKKMKQDAILINTARGELIDTKALVEELQSGHLGGAALDVISWILKLL